MAIATAPGPAASPVSAASGLAIHIPTDRDLRTPEETRATVAGIVALLGGSVGSAGADVVDVVEAPVPEMWSWAPPIPVAESPAPEPLVSESVGAHTDVLDAFEVPASDWAFPAPIDAGAAAGVVGLDRAFDDSLDAPLAGAAEDVVEGTSDDTADDATAAGASPRSGIFARLRRRSGRGRPDDGGAATTPEPEVEEPEVDGADGPDAAAPSVPPATPMTWAELTTRDRADDETGNVLASLDAFTAPSAVPVWSPAPAAPTPGIPTMPPFPDAEAEVPSGQAARLWTSQPTPGPASEADAAVEPIAPAAPVFTPEPMPVAASEPEPAWPIASAQWSDRDSFLPGASLPDVSRPEPEAPLPAWATAPDASAWGAELVGTETADADPNSVDEDAPAAFDGEGGGLLARLRRSGKATKKASPKAKKGDASPFDDRDAWEHRFEGGRTAAHSEADQAVAAQMRSEQARHNAALVAERLGLPEPTGEIGVCPKHQIESGVKCRRCRDYFCDQCLVPVGSKLMCIDCAMVVAGIKRRKD